MDDYNPNWVEEQDWCTGVLLLSMDKKDQIICRLLGSMLSHPAYSNMTSNLILALHSERRPEYIKFEYREFPSCSITR